MKKILLTCSFALICAACPLFGQKKTVADPQPQTQTQKKPPPYVYRTDYDVKMKEVDSKVNSAVGTAQALKRELSGKLDKVDVLDAKMLQVEEILNSANFKIGLTNDSLKKTRFSVDEFKTETDKKTTELHAQADMQKKLIWGAMGLAVLLTFGLMLMMNSRLRKQRNAMHKQAEEYSAKLTEELELQRKSVADELVQFKMRVQDDVARIRTEMHAGNEKTNTQLAAIMEKLETLDTDKG
jgi:flagellar biosynthesis/type III secretory pathway M-ring protein FliF/YscJ